MTKSFVKKYANHVRRNYLAISDYSNWVSIQHIDGSELFIVDCAFEYFSDDENEDSDKNWLIIWSQNHGTFLYEDKKIECWESGDMSENHAEHLLLPS